MQKAIFRTLYGALEALERAVNLIQNLVTDTD
jgi:hypothetical protein